MALPVVSSGKLLNVFIRRTTYLHCAISPSVLIVATGKCTGLGALLPHAQACRYRTINPSCPVSFVGSTPTDTHGTMGPQA